jgi:hypothetical protein
MELTICPVNSDIAVRAEGSEVCCAVDECGGRGFEGAEAAWANIASPATNTMRGEMYRLSKKFPLGDCFVRWKAIVPALHAAHRLSFRNTYNKGFSGERW